MPRFLRQRGAVLGEGNMHVYILGYRQSFHEVYCINFLMVDHTKNESELSPEPHFSPCTFHTKDLYNPILA